MELIMKLSMVFIVVFLLVTTLQDIVKTRPCVDEAISQLRGSQPNVERLRACL